MAPSPEATGVGVTMPDNGVPRGVGDRSADALTVAVEAGVDGLPGSDVGLGVGRGVGPGGFGVAVGAAVGVALGGCLGVGLGVGGGVGVGWGVGPITTTVGPRRVGSCPWLKALKVTGHDPPGSVLLPLNVPSAGWPLTRLSVTTPPATWAWTDVASCPFELR